jgi:aminoglycoside 6'-N-acetyltransferase
LIRLRKATIDDLDLLRRWDDEPGVVSSDPESDWNWPVELLREPDWREQLIAEKDGRSIGFVQIIDPVHEDGHYWGDVEENLRAIDIWIGAPSDRNQGHGSEIMRLALARCFAPTAVTAVLIDPLASNAAAHRFYERLGFVFVERRDFWGDDCFVYRLSRVDWAARTSSDGSCTTSEVS